MDTELNMAGRILLRRPSALTLLVITAAIATKSVQSLEVPGHLRGEYFSIETGRDVSTTIGPSLLETTDFEGQLVLRWDANTTDAENRHDSKLVFYMAENTCYKCFYLFYRTANIIQYKYSGCETYGPGQEPTLNDICDTIPPNSDFYTFFNTNYQTVSCKNTFEGVFNFTYEWDTGGGGICAAPDSLIKACQEPGSKYVDNQVFTMTFGKCADVYTSKRQENRFLCMGSWEDPQGNVWSAIASVEDVVYRERYRCMLTRNDQEEGDNKQRHTMSWWADCSKLKSPYEGPMRLLLQPVVGGFQLASSKPTCNFPTNYSGHWFHRGEFDVDVDINATHIYFKTNMDRYTYKESHFVCMMNSGSRYMTMAVTVGKCEIDYVCFDMMPRHHSIIRWRMGKPYRMTEIERAYPNYQMYMFRQACTWSSFTIDRNLVNWNYKTFLLNPPVPIECPIRGRYQFKQTGPPSELLQTRIRGVTVRPRHQIGCTNYVTEWKSCDRNPTKLQLDAEYCDTVDHTGRPIGEYDEPDWELTCVGYWEEDWRTYMVTWDDEDPTSAFRCWAYERTDWRFVVASRSTGASCLPQQKPYSNTPEEGASLRFEMEESERLYDDCAQNYRSGNPFYEKYNFFRPGDSGATSRDQSFLFTAILAAAATWWTLYQ